MKTKQVRDSSEVVDLINRALRVEYPLAVHHPRIASELKDAEARKLVLKQSRPRGAKEVEIKHVEKDCSGYGGGAAGSICPA